MAAREKDEPSQITFDPRLASPTLKFFKEAFLYLNEEDDADEAKRTKRLVRQLRGPALVLIIEEKPKTVKEVFDLLQENYGPIKSSFKTYAAFHNIAQRPGEKVEDYFPLQNTHHT